MAEPTPAPTPTPAPAAPTPPAPSGEPATPELDVTKLSGDQLAKVLENPELWKQPRLAELLTHSKEFKKLQEDRQKEQEQQLTEQKKFEELAAQRGDKISSLETQIQQMQIDQALTGVLIKELVVDLDAALKLVDRGTLSIGDNGQVQGIDEAIKSLKEGKSYLFGSGTPQLGAPTGGGATPPGGGPAQFKRSQLKDPAFYQANRDAILAAMKAGLIEDDLS